MHVRLKVGLAKAGRKKWRHAKKDCFAKQSPIEPGIGISQLEPAADLHNLLRPGSGCQALA